MTKLAAHAVAMNTASFVLAFVLFAPVAAAVLLQAVQVIA